MALFDQGFKTGFFGASQTWVPWILTKSGPRSKDCSKEVTLFYQGFKTGFENTPFCSERGPCHASVEILLATTFWGTSRNFCMILRRRNEKVTFQTV